MSLREKRQSSWLVMFVRYPLTHVYQGQTYLEKGQSEMSDGEMNDV